MLQNYVNIGFYDIHCRNIASVYANFNFMTQKLKLEITTQSFKYLKYCSTKYRVPFTMKHLLFPSVLSHSCCTVRIPSEQFTSIGTSHWYSNGGLLEMSPWHFLAINGTDSGNRPQFIRSRCMIKQGRI